MPRPKRKLSRIPDLWSLDTEFLLKELERIRGLALRVPGNTTDPYALTAPVNSVIDALWNLETDMRFCLKLQREMRHSFAQKVLATEKENQPPQIGLKLVP